MNLWSVLSVKEAMRLVQSMCARLAVWRAVCSAISALVDGLSGVLVLPRVRQSCGQ
jgi:hypothetical protein